MRLPGPMIWILSQQHHLNIIKWSVVKRREDLLAGWVNSFTGNFLSHQKSFKTPEIIRTKLIYQSIFPARLDRGINFHSAYCCIFTHSRPDLKYKYSKRRTFGHAEEAGDSKLLTGNFRMK